MGIVEYWVPRLDLVEDMFTACLSALVFRDHFCNLLVCMILELIICLVNDSIGNGFSL